MTLVPGVCFCQVKCWFSNGFIRKFLLCKNTFKLHIAEIVQMHSIIKSNIINRKYPSVQLSLVTLSTHLLIIKISKNTEIHFCYDNKYDYLCKAAPSFVLQYRRV